MCFYGVGEKKHKQQNIMETEQWIGRWADNTWHVQAERLKTIGFLFCIFVSSCGARRPVFLGVFAPREEQCGQLSAQHQQSLWWSMKDPQGYPPSETCFSLCMCYYPALEVFKVTHIYKLPFDAIGRTWDHPPRNGRLELLLFAKLTLGMVISHAAIWSSTTELISEGRALTLFVDIASTSEWWSSLLSHFRCTACRGL